MEEDKVTTVNRFQRFIHSKSEGIFTEGDSGIAVCGIRLDSEILMLLPGMENIENIKNYGNLKYLSINNFAIGKRERIVLERNAGVLRKITHLHIWNIKQNDLDIIELFPGLTHLLVSYIRREDFSFRGLGYADHFRTLCLVSVNRITDFQFLGEGMKKKIESLSIEYCSRLTSFAGIDGFSNLKNLTLHASTAESRKRVSIEHLSGIEQLENLTSLDLAYFNFDQEEMRRRIRGIKSLKNYKIDNTEYENNN